MPHAEPEFVVLVLGAGRGSRMGGPKVAMEVRGRLWCEWQRERLERTGFRTVWAVPPDVLEIDRVRRAMRGLHVVRGDPERPMFHSFLAALHAARPRTHSEPEHPRRGRVFVLPIDSPSPGPGVFHRLAAAGPVAVPTWRGKRGHPVCLAWRWLEDMEKRQWSLQPGDGREPRLDRLIAPDAVMVEVDDPDIAVNLNTRDDVIAWLAQTPADKGGS